MGDDIKEQIAALKEQLAQLEETAAEEAANKENLQGSASFASSDLNDDVADLPKKGASISKWIFGVGASFVFLVFVASIVNNSSTSGHQITAPNGVSGNAVATPDAIAKTAHDATNAVSTSTADDVVNSTTKWEYRSFTDGMDDMPTKLACVESDDLISQTFPYESTHTELCIRKTPKHGLDAYFRLKSDGQILCHSYAEPCIIKVRFDSGAIQSFSGLMASDSSSNIVFFQNAARMLNSISDSKQTRVQVELYQNGNQTTTFNTAGLVWPPI